MSEFKNFIKGFEEKPEAKNPNPAPEPKSQEVKMGESKEEESEFSKSRPAFTHDFAESLRKDAINWANEKKPYDKSLPKILSNYTYDEVIDFMRGNIGEDEIMKRAKERNGINQDRIEWLAKQKAQQTQPQEKKAEQHHEPKRNFVSPEMKQWFENNEMDEDYERSWGEKPTPDETREKATRIWNEYLKYATADQTPENIEKGNQLAEDFGAAVYPYLNPKQQEEFDTISGTFKDPDELWDYTKNALGWKDEQPKQPQKPQQKPKSPWEMETTGNPEEDERLNRIIEERVRKGYDSKGLYNPYIIKDMDYLGFGSLDELEKNTFNQNNPNPQPKQGTFQQVFGDKDEKETQPDGYYKDDDGEIYMMKGGKDYYPVGEKERTDFFRAFNNQNKEKAKEMASDPETARSFERIYADLDKGFEETYKRKPTQEEKDAIRDIARLQAALVAMATKK